MGLQFDAVAAQMLVVITCISFLVHIYSTGYMKGDPHLPRFMSYLSFFTFMMVVLVTADNYIQLFIGWEGVGVVFLIVSLLFKLTVAPFHMWALDIYEGASTPTIALLATLPKIAVFFLLVQVGLASNLVLSCACVSTVWGAVGALNQAKMKRMLAYSGVSHQGFIVLGLGLGTFGGLEASATYLPIYLVMCVCLFSAVCVQPRSCLVELGYASRENNVLA